MLNILFIIDPIETLHLETDTTFIIMVEAYRRKHRIWIVDLSDLRIEQGIPYGNLTRLAVFAHKEKRWNILGKKDCPLARMQIIFMRKDPPFSLDYLMATSLLSLVNSEHTLVINNPNALRNFNEKLGISQFPEFIPPTIVTKKYIDLIKFLRTHKKIVLKPLEGYAGNEIVVVDEKDKNRNVLLEMMTHKEQRYIMAQKYLPDVKYGDKRILILNGEILGQQNRIAANADHRSNVSAGGTSHKTTLNRRERMMCKTIGSELLKQGIYFAGIDMIGGFVTEINITSPTGLVKINEHEGKHLERKVLDFIETRNPIE